MRKHGATQLRPHLRRNFARRFTEGKVLRSCKERFQQPRAGHRIAFVAFDHQRAADRGAQWPAAIRHGQSVRSDEAGNPAVIVAVHERADFPVVARGIDIELPKIFDERRRRLLRAVAENLLEEPRDSRDILDCERTDVAHLLAPSAAAVAAAPPSLRASATRGFPAESSANVTAS